MKNSTKTARKERTELVGLLTKELPCFKRYNFGHLYTTSFLSFLTVFGLFLHYFYGLKLVVKSSKKVDEEIGNTRAKA